MANTYTQVNIHSVFTVKGRQNFLLQSFRPQLFQYISGILRNTGMYPLAVNGWRDHVHIFFELKPDVSISKTIETVKSNSSKWINENQFLIGKFEWQRGFGSFSYARSQRDTVINYILNQEEHHSKKGRSFKKEYLDLLKKYEIDYDPRYVFEFYEED